MESPTLNPRPGSDLSICTVFPELLSLSLSVFTSTSLVYITRNLQASLLESDLSLPIIHTTDKVI